MRNQLQYFTFPNNGTNKKKLINFLHKNPQKVMTQIRKIIRLNYDNFLDAPFFYYNEEFEIKNKRRQEGLPDQIYLFLFSYNLTLDYPLHLSEPNNDF